MLNFKFPHFFNPFNLRRKIKSREWADRFVHKKRFSWRTFWKWTGRIALGFVIFIVLLFAWYAKDLPTPGKIKYLETAAATQIFDRNGKQLYAFHGDVKRIPVKQEEIPEVMKEATITAEDRNFYRHFGIDVKGMLRAAYNIVFKHQSLQSGSTITQQYVKNALLDSKQTFNRKIKEIILSIEIEVMYSKEQIITMYLNEIPYGSNAYGIEAASNNFFDKSAKDLTLAEAATIAALPKAPTFYSPYGTHPDRRIARVNYILDSMADLNYVTKDEAAKAKDEAKDLKFSSPKEYIVAPHFVMYVKEKLIEKYGEQAVNEGGLKVTTTLDWDKQEKAQKAVEEGAAARQSNINASNAALTAVDPKTGQILAMVGSVDFFNQDIDGQVNVADSQRQPGSSFKPVVYAALFKDANFNPGKILWDVPTDFNGYQPHNYDGTTHGPISIRQALAGSLNIPAVKALYLAGMNNAINTAHDMGITTLNQPDRYGLSLVLGGGEIKLIDLVTAYGVFANSGNLSPTTCILKVENNKGKVLEEYKEENKQVLDPQIAYEISSILSDNDARNYIFGSSALDFYDRSVAVKTGTTSEYRDAWTVGYTPQLAAGVWVGNNDNTPMSAGAAGAMAAAPIWHKFMASALDGATVESFVKPAGITELTVDKLSNKLPTDHSPETITDIFASWQAPKDKDNIHIVVTIDKATGKRATASCPKSATENKVFTDLHSEQPNNPSWENPVIEAATQYGVNINTPPSDTACSQADTNNNTKVSAIITKPNNGDSVASDFDISASVSSKNGLKKVEFFIDDKLVNTDTSSPYVAKAKDLSSGKHVIKVTATDRSGNTSSSSIEVTVK